MAGLGWTFQSGLWLGRGPSPVDAMLRLQLGGMRAGHWQAGPARIWLRLAEEAVDQLLTDVGVGSSSQTRRGSLLLRVLLWEPPVINDNESRRRTASIGRPSLGGRRQQVGKTGVDGNNQTPLPEVFQEG